MWFCWWPPEKPWAYQPGSHMYCPSPTRYMLPWSQMLPVMYFSHTQVCHLNLLAPGKFEWNFIYVIFKWILVIDGWCISCEIDLILMSLDFTDDQSTLAQVMVWCHQATSHYLSQCWPGSLLPYGVTRPQWVNTLRPRQNGCYSPDDIFKCILSYEIIWILIKILLKLIPKGLLTIFQHWFK